MKNITLREKKTPEVNAALDEKMSDILKRLLSKRLEFEPVIDWLTKNGVDAKVVVNGVLARLIERGRNLPKRPDGWRTEAIIPSKIELDP